jgi:hypothetical protein
MSEKILGDDIEAFAVTDEAPDDLSAPKTGSDSPVQKSEDKARSLSPTRTSLGSSQTKKKKKPICYISWDGFDDSRDNVTKLKRFLKAKGYVIYEHDGGSVTGSNAKVLKTGASVDTDTLLDTLSTPINTTTTGAASESKDEAPLTSEALDAMDAKKDTVKKSADSLSFADSARDNVSDHITDHLRESTVFVACVTRAFTKSLSCKKLTLHVRKMVEDDRKRAPEMLYVMIHGDFTTESQPYHCRGGWLGYMLRDSLWSPAWSHAHIAGAAEAIMGVINLRRNIITLNPDHVLYIETRGKKGKMPMSPMGANH